MSTKIHEQKQMVQFLEYVLLVAISIVYILPIVVVLFGSLKTSREFMTSNPLSLPQNCFNLANYKTAFINGKMLGAFGNTIIIVGVSTVATVLTGSMTAYVLSRFVFTGKQLVRKLFLVASLIPSITMQMSIFQIISKMGLFNTRLSTILLYAGTDIISIYIFLQFLDNISCSLDEAAIMEGSSYFGVFFKIILPLLRPAIVTVVIIKGVGFYNEFYTPFLYMPSQRLSVISTSLFKFMGPYGSKWEVICAGVIITMLPTLIVFIKLQKQIYSGLTQGSVK